MPRKQGKPTKGKEEKKTPQKKDVKVSKVDEKAIEDQLNAMGEESIDGEKRVPKSSPVTKASEEVNPELATKPQKGTDSPDTSQTKEEESSKDSTVEKAKDEEIAELKEKLEAASAPQKGENKEKPEEKKDPTDFFKKESSGKLIFSNRTHFELVFSDLGFPSPGDKFDPLVFTPYEERDLEAEGFTFEQIRKSMNMRNFVASGKIKHGKLEEGDKLPEDTKFGSIRNLGGDVTSIGVKFSGHYFKLYMDFIAKEKARFNKGEV